MATTFDQLPSGGSLPFVLGIVGDSGSGKNTMVKGVRALLGEDAVTNLELDDYLRYTRAERAERGITALNPVGHNFSLMGEHLNLLRHGRPIRNRFYDHSDGTFGPIRPIEPNEVVLVRGLLGFPNDKMQSFYDLAVFLDPDSDLLFRWKLRRDIQLRGYTEAEALIRIAEYLLDSKQYVRPQAERADVVVRQELPEWDAPDNEVHMSVVLRRRAADLFRETGWMSRFADCVQIEDGPELVLRLCSAVSGSVVDGWAREGFRDTYTPNAVGTYRTDAGVGACCPQLAFAQVLIASLAQQLRRTEVAAT